MSLYYRHWHHFCLVVHVCIVTQRLIWFSIFLQINRDDDTVRPSFQDYAQDLKVSIFLSGDLGTCTCVIDRNYSNRRVQPNWPWLAKQPHTNDHRHLFRLPTFNPLTDYQVNVYKFTCITQSNTHAMHFMIISRILLDGTLMQMLQSDWLGDCILSAICVQWLEVIFEMAMLFVFPKFWRNILM